VALCLALSLQAGDGFAQENAAQAALLARDAEDLLAQGKTTEACAKLDQSYGLDPRGSTALDLAVCRDREGKIGRAYRMYDEAAEIAKRENRRDRLRTARAGKNKLALRVPKLTITVPKDTLVAGLLVTVNGEEVPNHSYGKRWEVDPGELVVMASAPGRKQWETKLSIAARQLKSVTIPELEVDDTPPPPPPVDPTADEPDETPPEDDEPESAPADARTEHSDARLVVEAGAFGGFVFHDITRGNANELAGQAYTYNSSAAGATFAECSDTTSVPGAGECEAIFNSATGGVVGGQLFVGWAVIEQLHLGARGFLAPRFPEGFFVAGGPSMSLRAVGPFWVGATFLFAATEHISTIAKAEGSIPSGAQSLNDGAKVIDIPLCAPNQPGNAPCLGFDQGTVSSGLLLGGTLELALSLLGPSPHAFVNTGDPDWAPLSGSLTASVLPTLLFTQNGVVFAIPAGLSYRFH